MKFLLIFAPAAFLLNFFWESWHAILFYNGYQGRLFADYSITEYVSLISYVSTVDMLMLLGILVVGMIVWRDVFWIKNMSVRKYIYFLGGALLLAVWVEVKGVYLLQECGSVPGATAINFTLIRFTERATTSEEK